MLWHAYKLCLNRLSSSYRNNCGLTTLLVSQTAVTNSQSSGAPSYVMKLTMQANGPQVVNNISCMKSPKLFNMPS